MTALSVAIVDTGVSNVESVANMCRRIGVRVTVTADTHELAGAERVLLPGVGAFDGAASRLTTGLRDALKGVVSDGTPLLGICLGMQLLFDSSDEGCEPGLSFLPGMVRRLPAAGPTGPLRIPHMGWNTLVPTRPSVLLAELGEGSRFYFAHSYVAVPESDEDVLTRTVYGSPFVSSVERGNVSGVQFHPEKSHRHGLALLRGFLSTV